MQNSILSILLWDKTLETGVKWIDDQHKQLLERIENLVKAIVNNQSEQKVKELVTFLHSYVKTHLSTEQKYMHQFNFPQTSDHLEQHRQFYDRFKQIEKKYLKDGPSKILAGEIANELWIWFKGHINVYDKKLGVFLKVRKAQALRSHKIPEKKEKPPGRDAS